MLSLGLGINKMKSILTSVVSDLLQKLIDNCGLIVSATPTVDEVGDSERNSVSGVSLVGNNAMYGVVRYKDGTNFTDDDMPTNYILEFNAYYNDATALNGFFGFEAITTASRFYCSTDNNDTSDILLVLYGAVCRANVNFSLGDRFALQLIVNGTNYEVKVNDTSYGSGTFTKTTSGNVLSLFSRELTNNTSAHKFNYIKLTDTDTNLPVWNFDTFQEIQDLTDSDQSVYIYDATGEYYIDLILPHANYIQETILAESPADKYGRIVADGITIFKDEAMTVPYKLNQIVTALMENGSYTTKAKGWVDDGLGTAIHPEFTGTEQGRVQYDNRVINGVVDDALTNFDVSETNFSFEGNKIRVNGDTTEDICTTEKYSIDASTQYTVVITLDEFTGTASTDLGVVGFRSTQTSGLYPTATLSTGENRFLITSEATIGGDVGLITGTTFTGTALVGGLRFYEGDYVTGDPSLPTADTLIDGNSYLVGDYNEVFELDDNNNNIFFASDGSSKVVPVADLNPINPLPEGYVFVNKIEGANNKVLIFKNKLADQSTCEYDALTYAELIEAVEVSDGMAEVTEGTVYVGKDGV